MAFRQFLAQFVAVGADDVLDVRPYQVGYQGVDVIDVVGVGGEEVPLALEAGDAVVVVEHGLQAVLLVALDGALDVLDGVFPGVGVLPGRSARLGPAGVVAGGEDKPVVADCPGDFLLFLAGYRMGPEVFDPDAILGGLGYLLAEFLSVGADDVLDVGSDEVREDGMGDVDVVGADEEQVELTVEAVLAVVVGDCGVQAVLFVLGDCLVDVFLCGTSHVFR